MTGPETIDYLTDSSAGKMTERQQAIAVVSVGLTYGYWAEHWELEAYDTAALANVNGAGIDTGYNGDLDSDLARVADNVLAFLNDNDIVPTAYDHGEYDPTAGYGNSTARDGAARLWGAGEAVGV